MESLNEELNRTEDNPQLQARYAQVTAELAQNEAALQKAAEEYENAEEALGKRAERWISMVNKITDKLNVKFAAYMAELQLKGGVQLRKVGRYQDYELLLQVSFREHETLSELDGQKHSGGERAVSTVCFLMALQDMTTSPFRVVDEINQGMDEANERLVFDRIVKSCCGDASKPQYFLVTPKLLQGLGAMRNPDVTVLLVWNGPGTGTKWVFSDILDNLAHGANPHAQSQPAARGAGGSSGVPAAAAAGASAARDKKVKPEPVSASGAAGAKRGRKQVQYSDEDEELGSEDEEDGAAKPGKKLAPVKKQKA
jgi:hypothetical protein